MDKLASICEVADVIVILVENLAVFEMSVVIELDVGSVEMLAPTVFVVDFLVAFEATDFSMVVGIIDIPSTLAVNADKVSSVNFKNVDIVVLLLFYLLLTIISK